MKIDGVLFINAYEAEAILEKMKQIINEYCYVTVSDLYDLVGLRIYTYSAGRYGWSDLSSATVVEKSGGYTIKFPVAIPITDLKNKKSKKIYNKLVRSNIPSIIASEGKIVRYTKLNKENNSTYIRKLADKLCEEVNELYYAIEHQDNLGREAVIEELADVDEVFQTLAETLDITFDEIGEERKRKSVEKGHFRNGTYLIEVEEGE